MLIKQHTHIQNILCSLLYCILTTKIQIGESFDLSKRLKFWRVKTSKAPGHAEHKWTPNTFDFSCQLKPTTQYFHPHTVIKTKTKTNKQKKKLPSAEKPHSWNQQVSDFSF